MISRRFRIQRNNARSKRQTSIHSKRTLRKRPREEIDCIVKIILGTYFCEDSTGGTMLAEEAGDCVAGAVLGAAEAGGA